jgi:hypothetical protein
VDILYEMARQDFDFIDQHDYVVINDDFDRALARLRAIRAAEQVRVSALMALPFREHRRATLVRYYDVPTLPGTDGPASP